MTTVREKVIHILKTSEVPVSPLDLFNLFPTKEETEELQKTLKELKDSGKISLGNSHRFIYNHDK